MVPTVTRAATTPATIASVETIPISIPFRHGGGQRNVRATGGTWQALDMLLVRITLTDGLTGWGESFAYALRDATRYVVDHRLAPALIGRSVVDAMEGLTGLARSVHAYGRGGIVQFALSGIDIALWDLRAKQEGVALRDLIGGGRDRTTAYASLFRYEDPDIVARISAEAVDAGFTHLKLHESDPQAVAAAREAAGQGIAIATDVNCPWTVAEAIAGIRALEPYALAWVEEPVWPPEDHEGLSKVRRSVATPLAAGENEPNPNGLRRLASAGAVDIIQPSITKVGGVSGMLEVIGASDSLGTRIVPHSFYYGPGLLATLQTATRATDDALIEWMYAEPEAHLFGDAIRPVGGVISTPGGAGLGMDPEPDVIAAYRTE